MKSLSVNKESGAVSLFVVIFAMLIITVMTISFLRLMMTDQRQASDSDLSQSAYDSAQAGVEDAKRALLRYQQICSTDPTACGSLSTLLSSTQCNEAIAESGIAVPEGGNSTYTGEVKVQQTPSVDGALNQAYTCVTMQLETDDYIGSLNPGESQLVPLVSRQGVDFDTVTVNWFGQDDVSSTDGSVTLPGVSVNHPFGLQDTWGENTPSVMRSQLIQFGDTFTMSSFDTVGTSANGTESNSNTVYLYPTSGAGATTAAFTALDSRKTSPTDEPDPDNPAQTPYAVRCENSVASRLYACSMSLRLPYAIGNGAADDRSRTAFLRLTPFYNASHFQVVLSDSRVGTGGIVKFKDVQPLVDSTGRANDLFRRIQSRVDLYNTNFPYPDATIDITGNFCKSFAVSDDPSTYTNTNTACTP